MALISKRSQGVKVGGRPRLGLGKRLHLIWSTSLMLLDNIMQMAKRSKCVSTVAQLD